MADYRLYFLDRNGRVERVVEMVCPDDAHALKSIANHDRGGPIELWHLARRIKVIPARRAAKSAVEAGQFRAC